MNHPVKSGVNGSTTSSTLRKRLYYSIVSLLMGLGVFCLTGFLLLENSLPGFSSEVNISIYDSAENRRFVISQNESAKLKILGLEKEVSNTENIDFTLLQISNTHNEYFLLWIVLVSSICGMSMASLPLLLRLYNMSFPGDKPREYILFFGLATLSIIAVGIISHLPAEKYLTSTFAVMIKTRSLLLHPSRDIGITVGVFFLPPLIALAGNFRFLKMAALGFDKMKEIDVFKAHRVYMIYLVVASVLLVSAVITTSLLRLSLLSVISEDIHWLFPKHFVIVYGLCFTFFLILFYLPSHLLFMEKLYDLKLRDDNNGIETMYIKYSSYNHIKGLVTMTAPLLTGVVMDLLS